MGLAGAVKKAIKDALLSLNGEAPVLKSLGLKGFRAAQDSEYDVVRKLLKKANVSK